MPIGLVQLLYLLGASMLWQLFVLQRSAQMHMTERRQKRFMALALRRDRNSYNFIHSTEFCPSQPKCWHTKVVVVGRGGARSLNPFIYFYVDPMCKPLPIYLVISVIVVTGEVRLTTSQYTYRH